MADIIITIPDDKVQWVVDALCDWGVYDENKEESETRPQFAKRMLASKAKSITLAYIRKVKHSEKNAEILIEQTGLDIT
jgi:hypothetical protein